MINLGLIINKSLQFFLSRSYIDCVTVGEEVSSSTKICTIFLFGFLMFYFCAENFNQTYTFHSIFNLTKTLDTKRDNIKVM